MADVDFESLADVIGSGAAVCLLGAGFSLAARQGDGVSPVPDTALLTSEIKSLMAVAEEEYLSLSDAAEICQDDPRQRSKLNSLLIQRLTSTVPTEDQKWLVNLNWRGIFTTNFDDVIEQARSATDYVPIAPTADLSIVPPGKVPIYYLHGRALDLREQDRDPSFVISESNYLELGSKNKQLYARLFNEIICARAVVLVGYSLRDLEIAKGFLNKSGALRDKTYIVTGPKDQGLAVRRLEKFGTVLPIGLDGFRSELGKHSTAAMVRHKFNYLREFSFSGDLEVGEAEITGDDFLRSVIVGKIDPIKYASQARSVETPYCVQRSRALEQIVRAPQQRFIVSSDFGNGKTAFLDQLAVELFAAGKKVYFVETKLPDVFDEIDAVMRGNGDVAFLIDDVVRYRNVAQYIGGRLNNRSILVCTTRGDQDAQYEQISAEMGGAHRFVDLNVLDDNEVEAWDRLLERWGYWELKSAFSSDKRRKFIIEDCGRENRSLIISLFANSRIASKIDEVVGFFLKRNVKHLPSFCGLLISSLAQRHVSWESLVGFLGIDESQLRHDMQNDEISFLFSGGRDWNFLTSGQLAEYILRNKFVQHERDVLVEVYSRIVLGTAESADDGKYGYDFRENLKELMKFRFLEKLFGETDASGVLIGRVYKKLSEARRIRNNPQFWLQYAMSRIKAKDLANAESFINTALGKAAEFGMDYNPFQIRDQRARLYFLKNTNSVHVSRNEITSALDDLIELSKNQSFDIVYTMRSLPIIEEFLEERIDDIEVGIRKKIEEFVAHLKEKTSGFERLPRSQRGETKVLRKALANIELILFNA